VLTEAGRALLPRARLILKEAGDIKSGISDDLGSGAGELSVGLIPTIAPLYWQASSKGFMSPFPEAQIPSMRTSRKGLSKESHRARDRARRDEPPYRR
jgi:DNA-binding transcriptional LysR family regulator